MEYYYCPNNNQMLSSTSSSSSSSSIANINSERDKMNNKKKNTKSRNNNKGAVVKLSTDPQSVAARERRHRISDRFKILQSLVPGGAKMDTVSMLEEAIHYVKFLKTQILLHQTILNYSHQYDNLNNNSSNSMFLPQVDQHYSLNNPMLDHVPESHVLQAPLPTTPMPISSRFIQSQEITPFDPFMKHYSS